LRRCAPDHEPRPLVSRFALAAVPSARARRGPLRGTRAVPDRLPRARGREPSRVRRSPFARLARTRRALLSLPRPLGNRRAAGALVLHLADGGDEVEPGGDGPALRGSRLRAHRRAAVLVPHRRDRVPGVARRCARGTTAPTASRRVSMARATPATFAVKSAAR